MKYSTMSKKNFQIEDKETGKKYWISRSMAVMCMLAGYDESTGEIELLVEKRGPGCPDNIGKLVMPCGYLDWDETLKEACTREIYEETGFKIAKPEDQIKMIGINDKPSENHQNVTARFIAVVPLVDLKIALETGQINTDTKSRGGEGGEVSDLKLMTIPEIKKTKSEDWAFGHKEIAERGINLIEK